MNPEDLLTDDLLTEVLRARADDADVSSTPLAAVTAHARGIRSDRRRRVASVLAAAAAVAAVVAGSTVLLTGGDTADAPTGPPPTTPTSSHGTDPRSLDALPLGTKPGIDYLVGDTYVSASGQRTTDPRFAGAVSATPVRGGTLVAQASPAHVSRRSAGLARVYLSTNGVSQLVGCGSGRFAVSTDGTQSAYWGADSCTLGTSGKLYSGVDNTMGEASTAYTATPAGSVYDPVGILRQGTVVNVTRGPHGHTAIVDQSGAESVVTALDFAEGSDENHDVIAGVLPGGSSATGAVVDATTGAVLWRSPWALGQFSPDGRYVLGYQPGNTFGDEYAILDAITGRVLVNFTDQARPVWDIDDSLLSAERNMAFSAIVRTDLHGHQTLATPIVRGDPVIDGYVLAARP